MKKKAQGLSINTIILAALGVLVLIVLIGVFTGGLGRTNKELKNQISNANSIQNLLVANGITSADLEKANERVYKKMGTTNINTDNCNKIVSEAEKALTDIGLALPPNKKVYVKIKENTFCPEKPTTLDACYKTPEYNSFQILIC